MARGQTVNLFKVGSIPSFHPEYVAGARWLGGGLQIRLSWFDSNLQLLKG